MAREEVYRAPPLLLPHSTSFDKAMQFPEQVIVHERVNNPSKLTPRFKKLPNSAVNIAPHTITLSNGRSSAQKCR
ncbi:MAG: hypothetical protein AAF728_15585, partial [Cyanobacteria bacterium P01_D01_bin.128]